MRGTLSQKRTAIARNHFTNGESTSARAQVQRQTGDVFWRANTATWVHPTNCFPVGVVYVSTAANTS
jgi:hypothetical protein